MVDLVEYRECAEVQEFLEGISPLCVDLFEQGNWIYRGVSRSGSYRLVPKSLRTTSPEWKNIGLLDAPSDEEELEKGYLIVERGILYRFYRALDEHGLQIPGDSPRIRKLLYSSANTENIFEYSEKEDGYWPPNDVIELLALAQHYGLPTRLLDWSRSPYHAAYFAVADVLKEVFDTKGQLKTTADTNEPLAVWAFHHPWAQVHANCPDAPPGTADLDTSEFRVVTVPSAANPNLHAQKGVFTLMRTRVSDYSMPFDRASLDEQLSQKLGLYPDPIFVCTTLPRNKAPELAEALMCFGIDAGSIYPGFQGAANSVIERNTIGLLRASKA
jgi:FRG domain